jgi:hypothetical protein
MHVSRDIDEKSKKVCKRATADFLLLTRLAILITTSLPANRSQPRDEVPARNERWRTRRAEKINIANFCQHERRVDACIGNQ